MNESKKSLYHRIPIFTFCMGVLIFGMPSSSVRASAAAECVQSNAPQSKAFPIQYIDTEADDLLALSKAYPPLEIAAYTEEMSADAEQRLADVRRQLGDGAYSPKELIGQAERQMAIPLLEAAEKIRSIITKKDTVLYLGRSPSVLCLAAEFLKQAATSVHINFSGTPNIKNLRPCEANDLRNVVTSDRLQHFCDYLDQKGLQKLTVENHLYIVDIVGTGTNMNSFLRILRHYFLQHRKMTETPLVTLLLMNFSEGEKHFEKYYYFNGPGQVLTFAGAQKTDGQLRGLKVHALPLGIAVEVQDFIDDDICSIICSGAGNILLFYGQAIMIPIVIQWPTLHQFLKKN